MPTADPAPRSGYRLHQWAGLFGGTVAAIILLSLPAPADLGAAGWRTAAIGCLMAIWWMTEAIPISATALLPLALFPLLGITDIRSTAAPYANPLIFLFLGGFLIAIAMERWDLHRRLALQIIRFVGTRPRHIIAGFAVAAAFMSMWVSNTATAMMMLPISLSIIELVRRGDQEEGKNFAVGLMLVVAYACSIGGMATLIGTPPNAFFAGFMLEAYGATIGFVEWMRIGLPLVVIALPVMFIVVTRVVYPVRITEVPGGRTYIQAELRQMGRMSKPEWLVAGVFACTAILWMTRPLLEEVVAGLTDAGIAMTMALLLFLLPVDVKRGEFVLTWKDAERVPWGVLILFGGGLSLASAIDDTGLAVWLGAQTTLLADWPLILVIGAVVATIVLLTELTSNTATVAAFLPIVASVGAGLGHDPLLLAIPAVLAASCAFMLPVATPPNAIVYGGGHVTIPEMARAGIVLNLIFIVIVTVGSYLFVPMLF